MGLSVNEFTYAGDDEFDLNFALGFTSREDVSAYKTGDPPTDLTFDWLSDSRVRLSANQGLVVGDTVVFRRTVSKLYLPVDLSQPGSATREALTAGYNHLMYIMHEVLDDRTADVFPWELLGGETSLDLVVNFDYYQAYIEARDS